MSAMTKAPWPAVQRGRKRQVWNFALKLSSLLKRTVNVSEDTSFVPFALFIYKKHKRQRDKEGTITASFYRTETVQFLDMAGCHFLLTILFPVYQTLYVFRGDSGFLL